MEIELDLGAADPSLAGLEENSRRTLVVPGVQRGFGFGIYGDPSGVFSLHLRRDQIRTVGQRPVFELGFESKDPGRTWYVSSPPPGMGLPLRMDPVDLLYSKVDKVEMHPCYLNGLFLCLVGYDETYDVWHVWRDLGAVLEVGSLEV